jgi:hypothetical protein
MSKNLLWLLTVLCALILGVVLGYSRKKVQVIHEKAEIKEKVVFRDRVINKVVYDTRTVTDGQKHVVDQKITFFGESLSYKQKDYSLGLEKETRTQTPGQAVLVGVSENVLASPLEPSSWYPHVSIPVYGPVNLQIQTNLTLTSVQVGLDIVL